MRAVTPGAADAVAARNSGKARETERDRGTDRDFEITADKRVKRASERSSHDVDGRNDDRRRVDGDSANPEKRNWRAERGVRAGQDGGPIKSAAAPMHFILCAPHGRGVVVASM